MMCTKRKTFDRMNGDHQWLMIIAIVFLVAFEFSSIINANHCLMAGYMLHDSRKTFTRTFRCTRWRWTKWTSMVEMQEMGVTYSYSNIRKVRKESDEHFFFRLISILLDMVHQRIYPKDKQQTKWNLLIFI